jgi:hypothetical protein
MAYFVLSPLRSHGAAAVCLQGLNSGLQLLQRAYHADPTHPGVLCALSHFSLLKGQSQQVRLLEWVLLCLTTNACGRHGIWMTHGRLSALL